MMNQLQNIGSTTNQQNGIDVDTFRDKATSFWKFLNDLSQNDPAAYSEFIHKQKLTHSKMLNSKSNKKQNMFAELDKNINSAKQQLLNQNQTNNNCMYFTPIPVFVIKTKIISLIKNPIQTLSSVNDYRNSMKKGQKLFLNFFESPYCKQLQCKSNINKQITSATPISDILVPIQISQLINESDMYWRCDIIYHNTVYRRFDNKINGKLLFKKWCCEYAFRRCEQRNSFKLLRDYKILKKKKFIGNIPPQPQFIGDINNKKDVNVNDDIDEKKIDNNVGGIKEIKTIKALDDNSLIKAIKNKNIVDDADADADDADKVVLIVPKYKMTVDLDKKHIIKIQIDLPKENDIKNIELDMNESKLSLKSLNYKLDIIFGHKVNDNQIKAKFDKTKHFLKLKLPIIKT